MAKYIKAVNLWDQSVLAQIEAGTLRLQTGQWVLCGTDKPSRFVKVTEAGTITAFHYPYANRRFTEYMKNR